MTGDAIANLATNPTIWIHRVQYWGSEVWTSIGESLTPDRESPSGFTMARLVLANGWFRAGTPASYFGMSVGGSVSPSSGSETMLAPSVGRPFGVDGVGAPANVPIPEALTARATSSDRAEVELSLPAPSRSEHYTFDHGFVGHSSATTGVLADVWQVGQPRAAP